MGTLLESKEALRARALEVHLTETEIDAIIANGVTSLARLAFAASQPGTTPTDDQVAALFGAGIVPNVGTLASIKRLVFEAQTLVIADVKNRATKKDDAVPTNMAPAERENRINEQRRRLTGLRLRGEEERGRSRSLRPALGHGRKGRLGLPWTGKISHSTSRTPQQEARQRTGH